MSNGILRQLSEDEAKQMLSNNPDDYGYICDHSAVIDDKELVIIWAEDFNEGKPCLVSINSIPMSDDGVLVGMPGDQKPPNLDVVLEEYNDDDFEEGEGK